MSTAVLRMKERILRLIKRNVVNSSKFNQRRVSFEMGTMQGVFDWIGPTGHSTLDQCQLNFPTVVKAITGGTNIQAFQSVKQGHVVAGEQ